MGYKSILKEVLPSKAPGGPKYKDPMLKKVGSSTDINVTGGV